MTKTPEQDFLKPLPIDYQDNPTAEFHGGKLIIETDQPGEYLVYGMATNEVWNEAIGGSMIQTESVFAVAEGKPNANGSISLSDSRIATPEEVATFVMSAQARKSSLGDIQTSESTLLSAAIIQGTQIVNKEYARRWAATEPFRRAVRAIALYGATTRPQGK